MLHEAHEIVVRDDERSRIDARMETQSRSFLQVTVEKNVYMGDQGQSHQHPARRGRTRRQASETTDRKSVV